MKIWQSCMRALGCSSAERPSHRYEKFHLAFSHVSGVIDNLYKELTKNAKSNTPGGTAYLTLENAEVWQRGALLSVVMLLTALCLGGRNRNRICTVSSTTPCPPPNDSATWNN